MLPTPQRLRSCLLALSLICSIGAFSSSPAQTTPTSQPGTWPTRQVRIIVPYPAGGGIDILGRQIAERMAPLWGQAVLLAIGPHVLLPKATPMRRPALAPVYLCWPAWSCGPACQHTRLLSGEGG